MRSTFLESKFEPASTQSQKAEDPRVPDVPGSRGVSDVPSALAVLVCNERLCDEHGTCKPAVATLNRVVLSSRRVPRLDVNETFTVGNCAIEEPQQHAAWREGVNGRNQEGVHDEKSIHKVESQQHERKYDVSVTAVALPDFPVPEGLFSSTAEPVVTSHSHFVDNPEAERDGGNI